MDPGRTYTLELEPARLKARHHTLLCCHSTQVALVARKPVPLVGFAVVLAVVVEEQPELQRF